MVKLLMQIFDVKAKMVQGGIMVVPTRAVAVRAFQDVLNASDGNEFSKHPEDYWLMELATQEDDGTIILSGVVPELVVKGSDLVQVK